MRWALLLSSYAYKLKCRPEEKNANVDSLSRLSIDFEEGGASRAVKSVILLKLDTSPMTANDSQKGNKEGSGAQQAVVHTTVVMDKA